MAVKLGSFTIPGGSSFSVTGVGFRPHWAIFLFGNKGVEDTWLDDACGGISYAAYRNSTDLSLGHTTCQVSERWYQPGNVAAGSFLGDLTWWMRQTNGSDGHAAYVSSIDADGWTFTFSSGFNSGAGGQIVYYLAGDQGYEEVGSRNAWVIGSPAYNLGWEPQAFFGIGGGGGVGGDGGTQSYSLFDQSVPSVCYGDWGEYSPGNPFDMSSQWRGLLDPNVDVQEWWGYEDQFAPITILEPTQSVGAQFQSIFGANKTVSSFQGVVSAIAGFSNGDARMQTFILGSVDSRVGSFVPTNTVGVPTHVDVGFTPEAVVFFSPGPYKAGVFGTSVQGATGWGFCTNTAEALLIYGGFWNPPTAMTSAMLISRNMSWVSNATEATQNIGGIVTAGSARVTSGGFDFTTTQNAATILAPVLYWAIAPAGEAPGFFRVI